MAKTRISLRFCLFFLSQLSCLLLGGLLAQGAIALSEDAIDLDFSLPAYQSVSSSSPKVYPLTPSPQASLPPSSLSLNASAKTTIIPPPHPLPQSSANTTSGHSIEQASLPTDSASKLFEGGTESLVARAIGTAEGTRTPSGEKTAAYYGHVDPGNGAWNLGSFSYQHGATSPAEADEKQLARLEQQAVELGLRAAGKGLELTIEEKLNGLDLANQAPLAALAKDGGSYVDRLHQAHEMGLQGSEAILWARTYAYLDPHTQQWNAPGLGNTLDQITHDQQRRLEAVAKALIVDSQTIGAETTRAEKSGQPQISAKHSDISSPKDHLPLPNLPIELNLDLNTPISDESVIDQTAAQIIFQDL